MIFYMDDRHKIISKGKATLVAIQVLEEDKQVDEVWLRHKREQIEFEKSIAPVELGNEDSG